MSASALNTRHSRPPAGMTISQSLIDLLPSEIHRIVARQMIADGTLILVPDNEETPRSSQE